MKVHSYRGIDIFPAEPNCSFIRWYAYNPNGGTLRADTLATMRELIKDCLGE